MEKEELKQLCLKEIESRKEEIIELGKSTYKTPELGYKEVRTTQAVADAFQRAGIESETGIAHTGVRVATNAGQKGPRIAVLGELDCVVCAEHPDAADTGNVHACGHHVQLANMYGCAVGLIKSGVLESLAGGVDFVAIPAEECVDYEFRQSLIENNEIKFIGGKQEYLARGGFDHVDMVLQCHMMEMESDKRCVLDTKCDGFIRKTVKFIGRASHAGFEPEKGINALNMAELAMNNIHAIRETFRDEDKVRVSMVITEGGSLVNVVPSLVRMQIMVRAFTVEAMLEASAKVNRGLKAAAVALGGQVEIQEDIGYLPLETTPVLSALYRENMVQYGDAKEDSFVELLQTAGSTDLGDISQMKPCMHIWAGGIKGGLHTENYWVADEYEAYVTPAKMLALMVIDLLYQNAEKAEAVRQGYKAHFTKAEYLELLEKYSKVDLFDGSII